MDIKMKRRIEVLSVIIVASIVLLFSYHEVVISQQPAISVYNAQSKLYASGNFTSISTTDELKLPSATSITYLNQSGHPASHLSLGIRSVHSFYDLGGAAMALDFNVSIHGSIYSSIHVTGLQFQVTAINQGFVNGTQIYFLAFMDSKAISNLSLMSTQSNANLTSYVVPFKLLNHPSESFFGDYEVGQYDFSYNAAGGFDYCLLEFTPSLGTHAFNLSLELEGTQEPVTASIEIVLTNV